MNLKYLIKEARYYKHIDEGLKRVGIKFLLAKTPLKKIVNSSLYNKAYRNIIKKKSAKFKPYLLGLENTNICNAKCIMCPHSKMKRKKQVMNQEDFEKIINNLMKTEKIEKIIFVGLGEPLCDKELERKIKFLNKNYKIKVIVFTNAALLKKERVESLLKLDILKINFSVNGTEKDYKKIMGLNYQNTIKNINYFLKRKKELGEKFPLTNISLMVLDKDKEKLEELRKFWMNKVDSVRIYEPSNWSGEVDPEVVKESFRNKRWPCINLWKEIAVNVNGNVIRCHRDYESEIKLGNLKKESYSEIKKELGKIKQRHLLGDFNMSQCVDCENSFESSLDWWE